MKRILALFILPFFLLSLACCASGGETIRTVRVNEVTHSVFYAPFYAAIALGYFEEEGFRIELINGGGSDKSMTAVLTGDADVGLMGPETAVYVTGEGKSDPVMVIGQLTKRDGSFLMGKAPDPDFTFEKLAGKSVIGGRSGGMPQMTLTHVLKEHGLVNGENVTVRTDVQFDLMGGAFLSGSDDYVTMFEPAASAMELAGEAVIVASVGEAAGEVPYTCFMMKQSRLQEDPAFAKAFLRALYKGQQWIAEADPDTIASVISPEFPDSDEALLSRVAARYREIEVWSADPVMREEAYDSLIEIITEAGVIDSAPAFASVVENRYAEAAVAGK